MPFTRPSDFFARNQGSLTEDQQRLLFAKKVAVIGCGGLGGYVVEELVRLGVGTLHLFDPDVFAPSNLNRQLNAVQTTLGHGKAEATAERAKAIRPEVMIRVLAADFRAVDDATALQVDVAVDCLDSVEARRDLARQCDRLSVPLVHGAVNGWCGQIGVHLPGGQLIDRLYPPRTTTGSAPSVLSFTVAAVASLQVAETVKLLLGLPSSLRNTWMHIDLKEADFLVNEL